jgi:hypothetical protein
MTKFNSYTSRKKFTDSEPQKGRHHFVGAGAVLLALSWKIIAAPQHLRVHTVFPRPLTYLEIKSTQNWLEYHSRYFIARIFYEVASRMEPA